MFDTEFKEIVDNLIMTTRSHKVNKDFDEERIKKGSLPAPLFRTSGFHRRRKSRCRRVKGSGDRVPGYLDWHQLGLVSW